MIRMNEVYLFCLLFTSYLNRCSNLALLTEIDKIKIIDFNISARLGPWEIESLNKNKFTAKMFDLYKVVYKNNNLSKNNLSIEEKIPKIIHQIWLGSEFPEKFKFISKKWTTLHPEWKYKLWTDKNIKQLFPLQNQKYFDECKNYGEKSDILRYEILYRFGGVYVDIDYECLRPFDILNHCYEFYAGTEPLRLSPLHIGNALIGSKAGHPILKECIESIKDYRNEKYVFQRTGPLHLTRAFCKIGYLKNIMIFPPTYIYPLRSYETLRRMNKTGNVSNESFGIHYWTNTWK